MTMSVEAAAQALREAVRETVRRHSTWYLIQGALMVIGGIVALVYPFVSSVAVVLFLGWILIISGIVQGISLIGAQNVPNFWLQLVSVVLSIIVGVLFLRRPGLYGGGFFEANFFANDTAASKLGLGVGKRHHWNTAVFLSFG